MGTADQSDIYIGQYRVGKVGQIGAVLADREKDHLLHRVQPHSWAYLGAAWIVALAIVAVVIMGMP